MFHESIVFFGVPSHVWSYNISVNDRINVRNIFKIYTSQEYCHPPLCNMDVSSRFTHHMTTGTNSVPSWPLEEMRCHTHGGVETYLIHLLMSHQTTPITKCFTIFILTPHYCRYSGVEMCLVASWHDQFCPPHYYESLPVCKHKKIRGPLSNYINLVYTDIILPGEKIQCGMLQ